MNVLIQNKKNDFEQISYYSKVGRLKEVIIFSIKLNKKKKNRPNPIKSSYNETALCKTPVNVLNLKAIPVLI